MAVIKQRRSNMAHGSTYHAPPKKDGAGGPFTFGSAKDTADYGVMAGPPTQATAVVVDQVSVPAARPTKGAEFAMRDADFPVLGGAASLQRSAWGAKGEAHEAGGKLDPSNLRRGVEFDSSHPRNQFAKRPHHQEGVGVVQQVSSSIDWTGDGVPKEVQHQIIKGSQNPAHLSTHQQPAPQVPLQRLKELTRQVAPPAAKHPAKVVNSYARKPKREPVARGH